VSFDRDAVFYSQRVSRKYSDGKSAVEYVLEHYRKCHGRNSLFSVRIAK